MCRTPDPDSSLTFRKSPQVPFLPHSKRVFRYLGREPTKNGPTEQRDVINKGVYRFDGLSSL